MKRLCIFAHYDKDSIVDDYVITYLKGLKTVADKIVFVTVSNLFDAEKAKLEPLVSKLIVRENIGYDFMSWQVGLVSVKDIDDFDEVVLCNDSCYAPLSPFADLFNKAEKLSCDFWGITDSFQSNYYIQSYFLVFRKKVVMSQSFKDFWQKVKVLPSKDEVITKYEVGLSVALYNAGLKSECMFKIKDMVKDISVVEIFKDKFQRIKNRLNEKTNNVPCGFNNKKESPKLLFKIINKLMHSNLLCFLTAKHTNSPFTAWKQLVTRGCPLIKVMLIRDNPMELKDDSEYNNFIAKHTKYNINMIHNHLNRIKKG